jgi:hypothetical protein
VIGIVSMSARTDMDKEMRQVAFEDIAIRDANFPSATSMQLALLKAQRDTVLSWPQTVSLDRPLADLAITQAGGRLNR